MKKPPTPAILVALVVLVFAAYWTSLGGGFVYDDADLIVNNRYLVNWVAGVRDERGARKSSVWTMLKADFAQIGVEEGDIRGLGPINYYRPVIALSYILDAWFWSAPKPTGTDGQAPAVRFDPVGFHLTNVLFHALNVLLVFFVARKLLGNRWGAALAAVLFAVHPIHTESVTWISGRTDVIAMTFFLGAIWAYLRFRRTRSPVAYGAAVGLILIGTFAKEMVATLGLVLALYEALDSRFGISGRRGIPPTSAWRVAYVAPFLLAVIPYFLIKAGLAGGPASTDGWKDIGFWTALASFFKAGGWYLGKSLWPLPLDLYPILRFATWIEGLLFFMLHVAVIGGALWLTLRRRAPQVALAVVGFYLSLAPLSSVLPGARLLRFSEDVDFPVSERFLYLPSLFLILGIAWGMGLLFTRGGRPGRVLGWLLVAVGVVGAGVATARRGLDWRDNLHLYAAAVKTSSESVRMRSNLGLEYQKVFRVEESKAELFKCLELQEEFYRRTGRRYGVDPYAYQHLGRSFLMEGAFSTAIHYYAKGYQQNPGVAPAANNFAFAALVVAAILEDPSLARTSGQLYSRLVQMAPGFALGREQAEFTRNLVAAWDFYYRQGLRTDRACMLLGQSFQRIAMQCLQVAGDPRPEHALTVLDRGLRRLGAPDPEHKPDTAKVIAEMNALYRTAVDWGRDHYGERLKRWPARPALHYLLGEVERYASMRPADPAARARAEDHFRRALAVTPALTSAALALADLLARDGKEAEAIAVVEKAAAARAASDQPLWHESAYRAARAAWERAGKTAAWRAMLARTLDRVAERLESEKGEDARTWNNLGYVRHQQAAVLGDSKGYEAAATCFRRALALDPHLVNAAGSLVDTLRRLGRPEEAEKLRREMRGRFPEHPFFQ